MPVSTMVNGHYGLGDVYISVPALIGGGGVEDVFEIDLDERERKALTASAITLAEALNEIGF